MRGRVEEGEGGKKPTTREGEKSTYRRGVGHLQKELSFKSTIEDWGSKIKCLQKVRKRERKRHCWEQENERERGP